jgi:hypothetical protein
MPSETLLSLAMTIRAARIFLLFLWFLFFSFRNENVRMPLCIGKGIATVLFVYRIEMRERLRNSLTENSLQLGNVPVSNARDYSSVDSPRCSSPSLCCWPKMGLRIFNRLTSSSIEMQLTSVLGHSSTIHVVETKNR